MLLTIVNDILDLATVDAGIMQLDIDEVDVDRTIDGRRRPALPTGCASMRSRSTSTCPRAPKSFHGDENRVRQILFNLLSNAANYAPEAQHHHARPARQPADRVRVLRP